MNNVEKSEDNLLDNIYEAVLHQSYYMFRLFHGTLAGFKDVDTLKSIMETFYNIVSFISD